MANMVARTLSLMYGLPEGWGLVLEGCNPCCSVVKYHARWRVSQLVPHLASIREPEIEGQEAVEKGTPTPAPKLTRAAGVAIADQPQPAQRPQDARRKQPSRTSSRCLCRGSHKIVAHSICR